MNSLQIRSPRAMTGGLTRMRPHFDTNAVVMSEESMFGMLECAPATVEPFVHLMALQSCTWGQVVHDAITRLQVLNAPSLPRSVTKVEDGIFRRAAMRGAKVISKGKLVVK